MAKKKSKRPTNSKVRLAMAGNLKAYQTYLPHEQIEALRKLTAVTRIPQTEYVRAAIACVLDDPEDVLSKFKPKVPK